MIVTMMMISGIDVDDDVVDDDDVYIIMIYFAP